MDDLQRPGDIPELSETSGDPPNEGRRRRPFPLGLVDTLVEREWLLIVCVVVFLMSSGIGVVSAVLPIYAQTYEVSAALVGLLVTLFGIGRIIMGIPSGQIADRWGPRSLLVMGPAIMALGSIGVAISDSYALVLVFRFVQGIGSGAQMTGGYLAIAHLAPKREVGRLTSLYQSSLVLGVSAGPLIGGVLADSFGFRMPFVVQAVLSTGAAVWAWTRFPKTELTVQHDAHRGKLGVWTRLGALLGNRNFVLVSLVSFTVFFFRGGAQQTLLPLLAHNEIGLTLATVGGVYALMMGSDLVALYLGGSLSDRFGRKAMIVPSLIMAGTALAWIGRAEAMGPLLAGVVVLGLSTGIGASSPAAYVSDVAASEGYGLSFGIFRTATDGGYVAGPFLAGLFADIWGLRVPFFIVGIVLITVGLLFAFFAEELHSPGEASAQPA